MRELATNEEIAKNIMHNRAEGNNKTLNIWVQITYRDFAHHGEDILIAEANKIIRNRTMGLGG